MGGHRPVLQSSREGQLPCLLTEVTKSQIDSNETDEEQYLSDEDVVHRHKKQRLSVSKPCADSQVETDHYGHVANVSRRCELCKQRKVKCDRGHPSCGWCSRNGAVCEYKERKKPGLRAGYGRELEQRLDRLEEILAQHSRILSLPNPITHYTHKEHNKRRQRSSPDREGMVHREETGPLPADSNSGAVPQDNDLVASAHAVHDCQQYVSGLEQVSSPQSMLVDTHRSMSNRTPDQTRVSSANSQERVDMCGTTMSDDQLPHDLLYSLVDLYFKHVNTWSPILHRRTTFDLLFGQAKLEEADEMVLSAIVATTLRFSTDPRLTKPKRQHYHDTCKQKVLLYGLENSSVKCLQALVILALDMVGSSNGPPGWNILALITRAVVQLGLSVEPSSAAVSLTYPSIYTLRAMVLPEPEDWRQEESHRRLFWVIYLLDRYATIATAFNFALPEVEMERRLPCRDALFERNVPVETRWFKIVDKSFNATDRPENLGTFAYYIEVLGILSDIHTFLKQRIDISALDDVGRWQSTYRKLDNVLNDWKFNLPTRYSNMAQLHQADSVEYIDPAWIMLQAAYHTTVIRLHSSAAYPTTRSPIFAPSYSASQRCRTAVEAIAILERWVVQNDMLVKLGPPFAFTLWVSARLLLVHGSTVEHKLSAQIYEFVETLRSMGQYWDVAQRYADVIQRVLDEFETDQHTSSTTDLKTQGNAVIILADMRRTAYDLEHLISRHPRRDQSPINSKLITPVGRSVLNEFEYLDVFDFFNYPRLPLEFENLNGPVNEENCANRTGEEETQSRIGANDFNITNFSVDAESDWLYRAQA